LFSVPPIFAKRGHPRFYLLHLQWLHFPLPLVLCEDLYAVHLLIRGGGQGVAYSSGNGKV
jgi:hypothetical protein